MAQETINVPGQVAAVPSGTTPTAEGGDTWREALRKTQANFAELYAAKLNDPTAADATITVGAEVANVRAITIQLKDAAGANVAVATAVRIYLTLDAAGETPVATGGSTGLADAGAGALVPVVAKKVFEGVSDATGLMQLSWTDTGTDTAYIRLVLPNGKVVTSNAIVNAI